MSVFKYMEVKSKRDRYDLIKARFEYSEQQFKLFMTLLHKPTGITTDGIFVLELRAQPCHFRFSKEQEEMSLELANTIVAHLMKSCVSIPDDLSEEFDLVPTRDPVSLNELINSANENLRVKVRNPLSGLRGTSKTLKGMHDSIAYSISVDKSKHKKPQVSPGHSADSPREIPCNWINTLLNDK